MLTGRTVIGLVAGAAIIGLASASMILDLTRGPLDVTEAFEPGEFTSYQITGDEGATHRITVTAERFEMELTGPGNDALIPRTEFAGEFSTEWTHQENGRTLISIQNRGGDQMVVSGSFETAGDPLVFAYHLVVITSGVVIIGFSMAFSLRKPRGF